MSNSGAPDGPVVLRFREDDHVRQVNILLVEDNDFTRSTVGSALSVEGCTVVASVSTAPEAIRVAAESSIDCAVIDLNLGVGPTGIDVAHALRKGDPDLAIVILTSYEDPRLLDGGSRPMPDHAVYVVKNDIHSTGQLRERVDAACELGGQARVGIRGRVPLTDGQVEILRLVAQGLTNAEIARRRVVTERSVETALARIVRRLGLQPVAGENVRVLLTQAYYAMIGASETRPSGRPQAP